MKSHRIVRSRFSYKSKSGFTYLGGVYGKEWGLSTAFQLYIAFVGAMLLTQQGFHLKCSFFFGFLLILKIVIVSDQMAVWYCS